MLPQSSNGYVVLSGLLGAIISAMIALISTCINNNFQLKREEKQRIWQEESDQKKWYREKIYDSYKRSIQVLTTIVQERYGLETTYDVDRDEYINLEKLYFEFNSEFEIIMAGYPNKDSEEFKEKMANIKEYLKVEPLLARIIITEMMEDDSRIKVINK